MSKEGISGRVICFVPDLGGSLILFPSVKGGHLFIVAHGLLCVQIILRGRGQNTSGINKLFKKYYCSFAQGLLFVQLNVIVWFDGSLGVMVEWGGGHYFCRIKW